MFARRESRGHLHRTRAPSAPESACSPCGPPIRSRVADPWSACVWVVARMRRAVRSCVHPSSPPLKFRLLITLATMTPLRWPLSHRSHRAVAHATRRRMAPAAMTAALALVLVPALSASAAWAASSDTDTSSAAASDSSKTDPTTCIGAYSLASSFSSQMVSMPSHMQRYLAATAAQRFWTMAAS